ncbi:sulfite exporter TauE/SafE family protein [Congregibacter variabilis]|uniref:Probable membrane transporter protein n=1 Tax=Congregibacter variabilis TaxID=3081200 RepID=A0ABZ0I5N9_9GAMM|nr:sulfite exporter TauE/SafE family protein [Congregibacter sp. IMCC43200]
MGELWPLAKQAGFVFVGIIGAIFANATGAGGGVVFIPVFHELGFTSPQSVATSFGIQCFGMTTGAIAWSRHYQKTHRQQGHWAAFLPSLFLSVPFSVLGLWTVNLLQISPPAETVTSFAVFSLLLGVAIILVSRKQDTVFQERLRRSDLLALGPIAFMGGIVTAWLSVGVGEFVAFYLILRRYDVKLAVAVAVVLSAITVWSAAPEQLIMGESADWSVIMFAGPGAIIGAVIARQLALAMNTIKLKRFFGIWLVLIGITELLGSA